MKKSNTVREPIATWWDVNPYSVEILPIQVVHFTASFVTYIQEDKHWSTGVVTKRERRESRELKFPTFREAKEYLRNYLARELDLAERSVQRYTVSLQKAIDLQELSK